MWGRLDIAARGFRVQALGRIRPAPGCELQVRDAFQMLDKVRAVKSAAEIALLRKAAALTVEGFWAGVQAIAPGRTERQVEAAVVHACMMAGSEGPSLWPWIKSVPNGVGAKVWEA